MYTHVLFVTYPDSVLGDLVDVLHHGIEPAADERGDGAYTDTRLLCLFLLWWISEK